MTACTTSPAWTRAAIAELGIGRKFQKPTVFESQSVADNILLALKGPRAATASLFRLAQPGRADADRRHPETVGLIAHRARPAADLSHGQKQWLEIACCSPRTPSSSSSTSRSPA